MTHRPAEASESPANSARVIKKYANRRLYDTYDSKYVTISDLTTLIRQGHDFVVINDKTGDDITQSILVMIILDYENGGQTLLPISFLRGVISSYEDNWLRAMMTTYLDAVITNMTSMQTQLTNQLKLLEPQAALPSHPMQQWLSAPMEQVQSWQKQMQTMLDTNMRFPFGAARMGQQPTPSGNSPSRESASRKAPASTNPVSTNPVSTATDADATLDQMVAESSDILQEIDRLNTRLEEISKRFRASAPAEAPAPRKRKP